jgi:hypothetical protein
LRCSVVSVVNAIMQVNVYANSFLAVSIWMWQILTHWYSCTLSMLQLSYRNYASDLCMITSNLFVGVKYPSFLTFTFPHFYHSIPQSSVL